MKKLQRLLVGFLLVLMFLVLLPRPVDSNNDDVPFIYYYSHEEEAFIIEKADGTAKSIWVKYQFPDIPGDSWAVGPGWSPSGKWFAWTVISTIGGETGGYPQSLVGYVVGRDGQSLISLIRHQVGTAHLSLQWSSVDDLLLVYESYYADRDSDPINSVYLFDPSTQIFTPIPYDLGYIQWSSDGRYLVINYYNDAGSRENLKVLSVPDLSVIEEHKITIACYFSHSLSPITNSILYNSDQDHITVRNIDTVTEFTLPFSSKLYSIEWSPDGLTALLHTQETCDVNAPLSLWILQVKTKTLTFVGNDMMLPDVRSRDEQFVGAEFTSWSPDSNLAFALRSDRRIFVIDTSKEKVSIQKLGFHFDYLGVLQWSPHNTLFINNIEYNPATNESQDLALTDFDQRLYEMSPDSNYLAYTGGENGLIINNLQDGQSVSTGLRENSSAPIMALDWHSNRDWLFMVGGNVYVFVIDIVKADGSNHRAITRCLPSASCFGWLPEIKD